MQTSMYYRHSGRVGRLAWPYMLGFGLAGALVLGPVYAYVDYFIPLIYLNLVACAFYGLAIGFIVEAGAKRGQVRSSPTAIMGGLVVGLIALYVAWVFWFRAASGGRFTPVWPPTLWEAIKALNARGAWNIRGRVVTGTELYVAWAAEALIVVGSPMLIAWLNASDEPFCEKCNGWVKDKRVISPLQVVASPQAFRARLEQGDYGEVTALRPVPPTDAAFTTLELLHCPTCKELFFLTARETTITVEDDGSVARRQKTLVENMVIGADLFDALCQRGAARGAG